MNTTNGKTTTTVLLTLVILAAFGSAYSSYQWAMTRCGLDYYQFWLVNRWVSGGRGSEIYGADNQALLGRFARETSIAAGPASRERVAAEQNQRLYDGRVESYSTPFLYAVLSPVASGAYGRAYRMFVLLSIIAYALGVMALALAAGHGFPVAVLAVAVLTFSFLPFRSNLQVMNVSACHAALMCAGIAMLLWRRCPLHDALAGVIVGLAVGFKPTVAPAGVAVVAVLAADRRWRSAIRVTCGLAAGLAAAWAIGCAYFGSWNCWWVWFSDLRGMLGTTRPFDPNNCSMVTALRQNTGSDLSLPVLIALLFIVGVAAWFGRDTNGAPERAALAGATGCGIALMASPYSWFHYYLLTVPVLLWTWRDRRCRGAPAIAYRAAATAALVLLFIAPIVVGIPGNIVETWCGNAAVVVLVVLGLAELTGMLR